MDMNDVDVAGNRLEAPATFDTASEAIAAVSCRNHVIYRWDVMRFDSGAVNEYEQLSIVNLIMREFVYIRDIYTECDRDVTVYTVSKDDWCDYATGKKTLEDYHDEARWWGKAC